jgi:hypothetical protein
MRSIASGECGCGCGAPTGAYSRSNARLEQVAGSPRRFVTGHYDRSGTHAWNWKGGRKRMAEGYIGVQAPQHPRADAAGYVLEHLLVAERALGRPIPKGIEIHHVDGVKHHNEPSNLVICPDNAYHHLLHQRLRALQECGDPSALRCRVCHGYERQSEIVTFFHRGRQRTMAYHRDCHAAKQRELRALRNARAIRSFAQVQ